MSRRKKDPTAPQTASTKITKPERPKNGIKVSPELAAIVTSVDLSSNVTVNDIGPTNPELADVDGEPPAWSNNRPEIAGAFTWFKSHQGGMYYNNGICYGFLIDGDSGNRCHRGMLREGQGWQPDPNQRHERGKSRYQEHIEEHGGEGSCRINYRRVFPQAPLTTADIVSGSKNTACGRKLPHRYNVMAYFLVTDVWAEKVDGKIGFKVRFEKLDLSEKSWWAKKGTILPDPLTRAYTEAVTLQCAACSLPSKQVYMEGWMCLNPRCQEFWMLSGSQPPVTMTFHDKFLEARTRHEPPIEFPPLVPNLPEKPDSSSSRASWRFGIVCPHCRKCIPRIHWNGWRCADNDAGGPEEKCPFERWIKLDPVALPAEDRNIDQGRATKLVLLTGSPDDTSFPPYALVTYSLGDAGYILHFKSNSAINSRPKGPDGLFQELQEADLRLRRHPMSQAQVGGTLTSQFSTNFGCPYKFVVCVESRGFDQACDPVLRALGRLRWATETAVQSMGGTALEPNELLLLGYFEDQRISYHDDGESTLGPTIATLSLGSTATMSVRMKYKYYHGFTKSSMKKKKGEEEQEQNGEEEKEKETVALLADDPVLPSCENYTNRQALKKNLLDGSTSEENYKKAWWESFEQNKGQDKPPDLMKIKLEHGDFVVMHGEGVQKYYEHAVELDKRGELRFALTARHVKKEHISEDEWKMGQFTLNEDQIYDGK
ncbi:uncharacterized protein DSM5745_01040 [Aspergillus mulundensis]|uniref:Alpha-ketoglutarate-dependent dioxygenase AlkB-like domain-containing protein n=1 Tax=Aspergillus mulundensis TaxID=1810919 RepID=A0A3D8T6S6_9EURO|nr:hypothetical protein DSM5745_01040 [Aspergillus mulundensis]RDW93718.1 hypothetical protein DSM5745_01040 [Aspergillus mulundensis]